MLLLAGRRVMLLRGELLQGELLLRAERRHVDAGVRHALRHNIPLGSEREAGKDCGSGGDRGGVAWWPRPPTTYIHTHDAVCHATLAHIENSVLTPLATVLARFLQPIHPRLLNTQTTREVKRKRWFIALYILARVPPLLPPALPLLIQYRVPTTSADQQHEQHHSPVETLGSLSEPSSCYPELGRVITVLPLVPL